MELNEVDYNVGEERARVGEIMEKERWREGKGMGKPGRLGD